VRSIVGPDQRWIVPLSILAAPILMLTADIIGRVVVSSELPAGVVTAFIGAPVLIALVRRKGARGL
jgi:iron complex transport system permease protein